ncbi:MAG TPA: glycerophosphodiester phosphodiesterase family protein [Sphingomicrobium sp.]|nr:glycerophosphodiester phosphodiesterase family protein [Sphingomicrobium sp.]
MRSSPSSNRDSEPDALDPGPKGFAHRGLHGPGVPENSMAAFRAALEFGAGIECDVRLSGDGHVMIFHDHDLRRMCASALAVESTRAEVLAGQKLFDSGEHIPWLSELLGLVQGKVPLLLELKCRGGNAARLAEAVARELDDYAGPVGVMSFEARAVKWFARKAPFRRRGLVISQRASAIDRWSNILNASPHFLAIDVAAIDRPWVAKQRAKRWIYSWTVRSAADRETAAIHADSPIWEGDGRPRS